MQILDGVNLLERRSNPLIPMMYFSQPDPTVDPGTGGAPPVPKPGPPKEKEEEEEVEEEDPDPSKGDYRVKKLSDENASWRIKNKATTDALEAANAKLREIEDKDKSELEKAQRDAKEALEKAQAAEAKLQQQLFDNAFLTYNDIKWKNAKTAMKLLDKSDIKINDDGDVEGMEKAIKALAKAEPYLVESETNDKGKPPSGGTGGKAPTGGGLSQADAESLKKKYRINT